MPTNKTFPCHLCKDLIVDSGPLNARAHHRKKHHLCIQARSNPPKKEAGMSEMNWWKSHLVAIMSSCCAVWSLFTILELCEAVHLTGDVADVSEEVRHPVVVIGLVNFVQMVALSMLILNLLTPKHFLEILFMILNAAWILSTVVILFMIYMDSLHPLAHDDQEFMRYPFHMVAIACYINVAFSLEILYVTPYFWTVDRPRERVTETKQHDAEKVGK